jgi:hypothetical protein
MMTISDFTQFVALEGAIHAAYPNKLAEANAVVSALNADATTHDTTIETAPAGLQPGNVANSPFLNDILLHVNSGKASNLTNAQMATAINGIIGMFAPPANTTAPVASGSGTVGQLVSCTSGVWTNAPASYRYQWRRGGLDIPGATSNIYMVAAADSGSSLTCAVTAANASGEAVAVSNPIAVA